jgi:hypothetical protein
MHEILPEKIARSTSRCQAKARLLALAMVSLPALASAQDARSQAPSYCFDLTRVVDLAMTKERFASIAGRPRQGSFLNTSLVLADWKDCSLYGAATYTCDSPIGPKPRTMPPQDRVRLNDAGQTEQTWPEPGHQNQ